MANAGAFLRPAPEAEYPKRLNLVDFLQMLLVGLSGIPGPLVRERSQPDEPKQPALETNWIAFELSSSQADFNPYMALDQNAVMQFQRQVTLELATSFYGPNALRVSDLVRDGFEIGQNQYWLKKANIGFKEMTQATRVPDLLNDRWVNRYERTILLRAVIQRAYPVPTLVSASGSVHSLVGNQDYHNDFNVTS